MRHSFIPTLTSGHICTNDERILLSLHLRLGGLGIQIITGVAEFKYNLLLVNKNHT